MNKEKLVFNFLKGISDDTQLCKSHPDYLGFVNCFKDAFTNPDDAEGFMELCAQPKYYESLMNLFNLTTESSFDLDETIFRLKTKPTLPTHTYIMMITANEPCDTGIKFITATSEDEAFIRFLSWEGHLENIEDEEQNGMGSAEQLNRMLDEFPIGIAKVDPSKLTDIDIAIASPDFNWYHSYDNEHLKFPELFEEI